jgi:glycosyltransferase involved in cell wall biosynthesis
MSGINISVIIATRHREEVLWVTVEKAIAAIALVPSTELIIVNDGDTELQVPTKFSPAIQLYQNPDRGVAYARNFGALKAKGNILFFIDDDMWINAQALHWINQNINNYPNAVFNLNWHYPPQLQTQLTKTKVGQYQLLAAYNTMWGRMVTGIKNEPTHGLYPFNFVMSGSLVISKNIFNRVGGYNTAMVFQGEDTDLTKKLHAHNIGMFCLFDVLLYHNQQDRFDVEALLQRVNSGFNSEFKAATQGHISARTNINYLYPKQLAFNFFCLSEKFWIWLLYKLPSTKMFTKINCKLLGMLCSLQLYKQWRLYKTA